MSKLPKTIAEKYVRNFAKLLIGTPDTKQTKWVVSEGKDINVYFFDAYNADLFLVECKWTGEAHDCFMEEGIEESTSVAELFHLAERGLDSAQKAGFHKNITWKEFYDRNNLNKIEELGYHNYRFATLGELRNSEMSYFYSSRVTAADFLVEVISAEEECISMRFLDRSGWNPEWSRMVDWGDNDEKKEHIFPHLSDYRERKSYYRDDSVDFSREVFHVKVEFNFPKWKYQLVSLKRVNALPKIAKTP